MKPLYLELPAVSQAVSLAEATIQREVREGKFPAPRQISGRRVGWLARARDRGVGGEPPQV